MRRFTSILMLLAMFAVVSWGQTTETIQVSTSADAPEHVYTMKSGNGYWVTGYTSPTSTESNAALFAFYAVDGVANAYKIYCFTSAKWLSYTKASGYSNATNFVKLVDEKESAEYWNAVIQDGKDNLGNVYCIAPYNTTGVAAKYMNWYQGVNANPLDNTSITMGLWQDNATGDAGSAWILSEMSVAYILAEYETWKASIGLGDKLGYYTVVDQDALESYEEALRNATTVAAALAAKESCMSLFTLNEMEVGKYYRIKNTVHNSYMGLDGATLNMKNKPEDANDPTFIWQYVQDGDNFYLKNVYSGLYPQYVAGGAANTTKVGTSKEYKFTYGLHQKVAGSDYQWNIFNGGRQINIEENGNVNQWYEANAHHYIYEVEAPSEELCKAWYEANPITLMDTPAKIDIEEDADVIISPNEFASPATINAAIDVLAAANEGDLTGEKIHRRYEALAANVQATLTPYVNHINTYDGLLSRVYTPTAEWGTLIMPIPLLRPEGWMVYTCMENVGNVLTLAEQGSIERNKAYIIEVEESKRNLKYQFIGYGQGAATTNQTTGLLTGVLEEGTTVPAGSYILSKYNDKMGFYRVAEGTTYTAVKNKCYLTLPPASEARYSALFFDGTETGIDGVAEAETSKNNGAIYNMAGQRMNKLQKGLNIVGGKIVIK